MKHVVTEVELRNGAKGLLIDVPDATVASYQIYFRAGDQYVASKDIYETAHIMEHMAFGANADFDSSEAFSAEAEKNGAYFNASTGGVGMTYYADCADFEWERILKLQQLSITQPKFLETEFKAESGNVREELTGYLSRHPRVLWQNLARATGNPLLLDSETIGTISKITTDDIRTHYRATHTLKNMRFVLAGNFKKRHDELKAMLEKWELPKGKLLDIPEYKTKKGEVVHLRRKDVPNLTFGLAMLIDRRMSDAELQAMSTLDHILTGTFHSRIFGKARQRGLCYGMSSDTSGSTYNSEWAFGGQVSLENAPELIKLIVDELLRVKRGDVSAEELADAKSYALGRLQMRCQTVSQIANWYAGDYFFDGTIDHYEDMPKAIEAVSVDQIVKLANEFFAAKKWTFGGIGNAPKELLKQLNKQFDALF